MKWLSIIIAVLLIGLSLSWYLFYTSAHDGLTEGKPPAEWQGAPVEVLPSEVEPENALPPPSYDFEASAPPAEWQDAQPEALFYKKDTGDAYVAGIDKMLDKMASGSMAFNAPNTINIDDSPEIQLILSLDETVAALKQAITEEGRRLGATVKVSPRMEARLTGNLFQITAITPEIQAVSGNQRTEWKWEVQPKKEGAHELHLTLTALVDVDGYSTPRVIRTFDAVIEVNVTTTQKLGMFFGNNWQWLWAAILLPVGGWLWRRKKKAG